MIWGYLGRSRVFWGAAVSHYVDRSVALLLGVTLSAPPVTMDVTRPVGRVLNAMAKTDEKIVFATSAAAVPRIVLGGRPVRVVLAGPRASAASLRALLQNLGSGEHLGLLLNGLSAAEPPGIVYDLYLDLPPGATPAEDDPHYVGTFNFFNFVPLPGVERGVASTSVPAYSFDITEVARTLQQRGLLRDPLTATIVPGGMPAIGARAVIGEIALVSSSGLD
jgi:hypothetical protein